MTDEEYQAILTRIDLLLDARLGTEEGSELDRLTKLLEDYEKDMLGIKEDS